jgi:hypothetical protein
VIPRNNGKSSPSSSGLLDWRRKICINKLLLIKHCMHLAINALLLRSTLDPRLLYHLLLTLLVLLKLLLLRRLMLPIRLLNKLWLLLLMTSASAETTLLGLLLPTALHLASANYSLRRSLPLGKGTC